MLWGALSSSPQFDTLRVKAIEGVALCQRTCDDVQLRFPSWEKSFFSIVRDDQLRRQGGACVVSSNLVAIATNTAKLTQQP